MKAIEFTGNLNDFVSKYAYQPALTQRLDKLDDTDFTQQLINEIVLWKVNRYVALDNEMLLNLNKLATLSAGEHRQAEAVLKDLLQAHGVDLPMASTLLRFRNPRTFQIIDQHAYRAIYGTAYPLHASTSIRQKVAVYFDYLDELLALCGNRTLNFETIDRLLYVFDKEKNGKLRKKV